jgi:hypothetical protein
MVNYCGAVSALDSNNPNLNRPDSYCAYAKRNSHVRDAEYTFMMSLFAVHKLAEYWHADHSCRPRRQQSCLRASHNLTHHTISTSIHVQLKIIERERMSVLQLQRQSQARTALE